MFKELHPHMCLQVQNTHMHTNAYALWPHISDVPHRFISVYVASHLGCNLLFL